MTSAGEDERWQEIVANFGDRVELEHEAVAAAEPPADPAPTTEADLDLFRPDDAPFRPPDPPPLPVVEPHRMLAWIGLFVGPAVLLVATVAGIDLPTWLMWLVIGGFLGGFGYLVYLMPRGPRDPFDDGARL